MARIAVLIDGSNFLSQLDACGLGYPALAPLLRWIAGSDELVFARFYSAPYITRAHGARWQAFQDANRHIPELQFFHGYRNSVGEEKAIDVALAVDLIYGCCNNHFDKVVVIGGDGDHIYALKVARSLGRWLRVFLMPQQHHQDFTAAGIAFTHITVADLEQREICDRGSQVGVPLKHRAASGSPQLALRLRGALARPIAP